MIDSFGANWVRLVVTAPDGQPGNEDIVANVDVYDAGAGVSDDWLFVNARRPAYFPLQQNGGIGGLASRVAADHIADWLALFPGRFVTLGYGTNDALMGVQPEEFRTNMASMIKAVIAYGMTPIVPKIPWGAMPACRRTLRLAPQGLRRSRRDALPGRRARRGPEAVGQQAGDAAGQDVHLHGINGLKPEYSGAAYRKAIRDYVALVHKHGMYAELALMWAAPGTEDATYQPEAPNADHSPAFWHSLATAYKDVPNVLLAPWGEATVGFDCFLEGGCTAMFDGEPCTTAGMQQAVDVMRTVGYKGAIVIPGVEYANDLSEWLTHKPVDPLGQTVAEAHVSGGNACETVECFDLNYAPVAAQVPLIFGETGEVYDASSCASTNIERFMTWADAHGVGYLAWQWDLWGTCLDLISDFDGTPAGSDYATWVHAHYATLE